MPITVPTDISGCILWLDADDAGTITLSGSNITQWNDKSGVGNNFIPIVSGVGPIYTAATLNGKAAAVWPATNNMGLRCAALTLTQPFTVFIVGLIAEMDAEVMLLFAGGSSYASCVSYHPTASGSLFVGDGTSFASNTFTINTSAFYTTAVLNGASSLARHNGVAKFTSVNCGTTNPTNMHIGRASGSFDGLWKAPGSYVAEIVVYNTALSSGNYLDVEAYLAAKWFAAARRKTGMIMNVT